MIGVDNDQVLERDAGGSIIQHWRIGEIENVLIPVIKIDKQKQIAQLIQLKKEKKRR
jgi:type I restriction enzyme S subunit